MMRKSVFLLLLPVMFTGAANYEVKGKGDPLTLTINTDSRMYFVGERLRITYTWENIGEGDVQFVAMPKGYTFRKAWIRVYDAVGREMERKEFPLKEEKRFGRKAVVSLRPHEKHTYALEALVSDGLPVIGHEGLCLDFGDSAILLTGYGTYRLKADLEFPFAWYYENDMRVFVRGLWQGRLKSNTVSITIVES